MLPFTYRKKIGKHKFAYFGVGKEPRPGRLYVEIEPLTVGYYIEDYHNWTEDCNKRGPRTTWGFLYGMIPCGQSGQDLHPGSL